MSGTSSVHATTAYRTEETYLNWIRQYIIFHNKRHPAEMGAPEVTKFLTHLAVNRHVAASTQNQALAAPALPLQKRAETGSALARKCRAGQKANPPASGVNKIRGQVPALATRATELAASKFALWRRAAPRRMFEIEGEGFGFWL